MNCSDGSLLGAMELSIECIPIEDDTRSACESPVLLSLSNFRTPWQNQLDAEPLAKRRTAWLLRNIAREEHCIR